LTPHRVPPPMRRNCRRFMPAKELQPMAMRIPPFDPPTLSSSYFVIRREGCKRKVPRLMRQRTLLRNTANSIANTKKKVALCIHFIVSRTPSANEMNEIYETNEIHEMNAAW
jgi:hypothetical protein